MKAFLSDLWMLASIALGVAVFLGLMWFLARAHSFRWRTVSRAYAGPSRTPSLARKPLDTIIISEREREPDPGDLGWRIYPGVRIAVHENGLAVSLLPLLPPFNIMCPTLFLPYDEMETAPTWWALWREPAAIRMKRAPTVDIIIARDTVAWLRDHCDDGPFRREPL